MAAVHKKYRVGTKLMLQREISVDTHNDGYQAMPKGTIVTVAKSRYEEAYDFQEWADAGYMVHFIEDETNYKLAGTKSWKKTMEE